MEKKYLKVLSMSLLMSGLLFISSACACSGKVKITFVSEGNSDIVRYVKKGKSLYDLPNTPEVKGKYCVWDREDFQNIEEDITVNALCYSTVTDFYTNIPDEIDVEVSSQEAELDYIFKDAELKVTFESGERKILYKGDYTIEAGNYNKDKGGSYIVSVKYNNAKKDVKINVNKFNNYVSVSLNSGIGYYNEGLPALVANTDVPGSVSFDQEQTLYEGKNLYSWTFTPVDTDKYDIVKGKIEVDLQKASSINLNKESIVVDFGMSASQIVDLIKDGLVVTGKYNNVYKEVKSDYYTIDSSEFQLNKSGTYTFKVVYDEDVSAPITVIVNKCKTYNLVVNDVDEFIVKEGITLNDVISKIVKTSDIEGTIKFSSGQVLTVGDYQYNYIFEPNNTHYATKEGKIRIKAYKANEIEFNSIEEFEYGTTGNNILEQLKNNIIGKVYYNDDYSITINPEKVSVSFQTSYDDTRAGEYKYKIIYNDEIEKEGTFILNRRVLQKGVDFDITCGYVDPDNVEMLPDCSIEKLNTTKFDFDPQKFSIVPLSVENKGNGVYEYKVEIVPDDSISSNYEGVITYISAQIN